MVVRKARGSLTVRWRAKDGKPGTDGDDAVTYDIVPSVSVLNANPDGRVVSDGIIVRAYRTEGDVRSLNILPEDDYPDEGDYYFAEYSIDGGVWKQCGMFYYPTGPSDDIEWIDKYGIGYQVADTAKDNIAFRLKHSSNPNVVLKEIAPIRVVKDGEDGDDAVTYDIEPSVSVINASSKGVVSTGAIEVKAYRTVGSVRSGNLVGAAIVQVGGEELPYYYVEYSVDGGTWTSCDRISIGEGIHALLSYGVSATVVKTITVGIAFRLKHSSAPTVVLKELSQIKVIKDGGQGEPGLDGCIRRIREWKVGEEYRNDTALQTSGLRYIDIAVKKQNGKVVLACICQKTHTATAALMPQDSTYTTVDGVRYWEKINNLSAIYTPFIWADDAVFQFAQTNQLVVLKENTDTVNVALGGGTWPFWVGATAAGLNGTTPLAPFQIKDNGEFWATKAHITGEVQATSGTIGGFNISSSAIGSTDYSSSNSNHLYISRNYMHIGSNACYVEMGSDISDPIAGGSYSESMEIKNSKATADGYSYYGQNYGLYISISGASKNIAIAANSKIISQRAVYCDRCRVIDMNTEASAFYKNISEYNIFILDPGSDNWDFQLPTEATMKKEFLYHNGWPTSPYFCYRFTLILKKDASKYVDIHNVYDNNGTLQDYIRMSKGDVMVLICTNYGGFHYKVVSRYD